MNAIERMRKEIGHPRMVVEPMVEGCNTAVIHFLGERGYDAYVEYDFDTERGRVAKSIVDPFGDDMPLEVIILTVKSMMI